ncbi:MAG TPA: polyheme membrane-associated cytochrome C [Xanthobacteraceae bacterium]|nr:polyheme membrane-associated cytochrome C [Xanthobacteraceae bacterium]
MSANSCRPGFTIIAILAATVLVLASGPGRSQERTEIGVPLQFWKGHFDRHADAFHEWDSEKEIPAVCARCHGATSLPEYLKEGKTTAAPHAANGLACTNCHADLLTYARQAVAKVTFPSGLTVDSGNNDTNLCTTCHQGRESTLSVNKAIAGLPLDTPDPKLNFIHVHFYGAGATRYGTEAKGGYEYDGKTYVGRFAHMPNVSTCTGCHQPHGGEVKIDRCGGCHDGIRTIADLANIRVSTRGDFDGNGKEEGLAKEITGLQTQLYAAIQTYAKNVGGVGIGFTEAAYPHWFADKNGNGRIDPEEAAPANKYPAYTPRLLQAVYNYTYSVRDPGGAYHNGRYVLQLLHDSLESLAASGKAGVNMNGKARP